jgi:hypothetical protein
MMLAGRYWGTFEPEKLPWQYVEQYGDCQLASVQDPRVTTRSIRQRPLERQYAGDPLACWPQHVEWLVL